MRSPGDTGISKWLGKYDSWFVNTQPVGLHRQLVCVNACPAVSAQ